MYYCGFEIQTQPCLSMTRLSTLSTLPVRLLVGDTELQKMWKLTFLQKTDQVVEKDQPNNLYTSEDEEELFLQKIKRRSQYVFPRK